MSDLRVALAQVNPTVGDIAGNRELVVEAIGRARSAGAGLVVFPELVLAGYPPEDLLLRPGFICDCRMALDSLLPETEGLTAVVGFPEGDEDGLFNSAAVIADRRLAGVYRKAELPNYGVFDEKRYFTAGTAPLFLEAGGRRIMVTICEDIWVPGSRVEAWAVAARPDMVVNLSASPFHAGKAGSRLDTLRRFAGAAGAPVCYCNVVGGQDELVFDGGSMVMSPSGAVMAEARRFCEDLLVAEFHGDGVGQGGGGCGRREEGLTAIGEIRAALVLGTRDFIRKNGFSRAVLGLSGGIDSALVAVLAVEALGAENVTAVTMPSEFTSSATLADARRLATNLDIELITVPIHGPYGAHLEALRTHWGGEPGLAGENLQARVRGNILMALSNARGWLVLTTGNKSETAVGYCTLYGDTAGGFAVIKDLFKRTVYELSEEINRTAGRELIPRSIIERAPTAELRPDQKDEDSLPPYRVLDPILKAYVEDERTVDEIVAMGFDPRVVTETVRLVDRSEFKRRQSPPGVKITPKAFGRDRRLPVTNRYRPTAGG
jgi:NAD+ synthase (glutamine-hydrolysing)